MGLNAPTEPSAGPVARLVAFTGRSVAWVTLAMTLLTFLVVLLRYGFNLGWIWLQESVTYLHAMVFMVAAAWTYDNATSSNDITIHEYGLDTALVLLCLFVADMLDAESQTKTLAATTMAMSAGY